MRSWLIKYLPLLPTVSVLPRVKIVREGDINKCLFLGNDVTLLMWVLEKFRSTEEMSFVFFFTKSCPLSNSDGENPNLK